MDNTDGWPDKICIQCVHQVSRCHAFKTRVEKADQQLKNYIKGITVIVEEPIPKEISITQIELQRSDTQQHHIQRSDQTHLREIQHHVVQQQQHQPQQQQQHQQHHQQQHQQLQRQEIQIQRSEIQTQTSDTTPHQIMITNGQLHNTTAQIINGQIVTTSHGQPILQTGGIGQIVHQGQLIQTGNTVQMIQQNGQPQVVQIQRTSDDRCEIIVQPDLCGEAQYYEDGKFVFTLFLEIVFKFFLSHRSLMV